MQDNADSEVEVGILKSIKAGSTLQGVSNVSENPLNYVMVLTFSTVFSTPEDCYFVIASWATIETAFNILNSCYPSYIHSV
jgi:hypothetical protein